MELVSPFEILEMRDGEVREFTVLRWEEGTLTIRPRYPGAPALKVVTGMRLFVPREDKPLGAPYWDVTSGTLRVQLKSIFETVPGPPWRLRIRKVGEAPKARFEATYLPSEAGPSPS